MSAPVTTIRGDRKICSRCKEAKLHREFGPNRARSHGLQAWCRACQRIEARKGDKWRRYGLRPDDIQRMLIAQDHKCLICEDTLTTGPRGFSVDHDHTCCAERARSCGKCIRGLLCALCNLALGAAGDDPDRLRRMADYVEEHR